MSATESDKDLEIQLEAIKVINDALKPLTLENRERVLQYVLSHLGINSTLTALVVPQPLINIPPSPIAITPGAGGLQRRPDIRSFTEEKQPRTASEMAAVAAFFLSDLASQDEKLDDVTNADIMKLYKVAGFIKLPKDPKQLLKNAALSGYFDSVSHGKYKLNAVGYNLVVHNLPHTSGSGVTKTRRSKLSPKKSSAKKK